MGTNNDISLDEWRVETIKHPVYGISDDGKLAKTERTQQRRYRYASLIPQRTCEPD